MAESPVVQTLYGQVGRSGPLARLIGEPEEVAEKIIGHSEMLGGISRIKFQMSASSLPHSKLMRVIEVLGEKVARAVRRESVRRNLTVAVAPALR